MKWHKERYLNDSNERLGLRFCQLSLRT